MAGLDQFAQNASSDGAEKHLPSDEHRASVLGDFVHSAGYSLQNTLNGPAQLFDKVFGTSILPNLQFVSSPDQASPYSSNWIAQQIGSGIGMLPGLALASRITRLDSTMPLIYESAEAVAGARGAALAVTPTLGAGLWHTAKTGLFFSGILSPSKTDSNTFLDFARDRGEQAILGSATFLALGVGYLGANKLLGLNQFGSNLMSGLVVGGGSAYVDAQLQGRKPSVDNCLQSGISFAVAGIAMPIASNHADRVGKYLKDKYYADSQAEGLVNHATDKANDVMDFVNLRLLARGVREQRYWNTIDKDYSKAVSQAGITLPSLNDNCRVQWGTTLWGSGVDSPRVIHQGNDKSTMHLSDTQDKRLQLGEFFHERTHANQGGLPPGLNLDAFKNEMLTREIEARTRQKDALIAMGSTEAANVIKVTDTEIRQEMIPNVGTYDKLYEDCFKLYEETPPGPDGKISPRCTEYGGSTPDYFGNIPPDIKQWRAQLDRIPLLADNDLDTHIIHLGITEDEIVNTTLGLEVGSGATRRFAREFGERSSQLRLQKGIFEPGGRIISVNPMLANEECLRYRSRDNKDASKPGS